MTSKTIYRIIVDVILLVYFLYQFIQTPVTDIKQLLLYTALITSELVSINKELRRN